MFTTLYTYIVSSLSRNLISFFKSAPTPILLKYISLSIHFFTFIFNFNHNISDNLSNLDYWVCDAFLSAVIIVYIIIIFWKFSFDFSFMVTESFSIWVNNWWYIAVCLSSTLLPSKIKCKIGCSGMENYLCFDILSGFLFSHFLLFSLFY